MTAARDTIFAPATGAAIAALAVVRVSGPRARDALRSLAGGLPAPRRASLRRLRGVDGEVLDEALVLWMPGPDSYTGEDTAELHLHGGRGVTEGVLAALSGLSGLRMAEPGEFTRRAFENGRMDLAQAEAVADLIDAETVAQRRQALDQLGGALTRRHEQWRALFLDALSWLQAAVDFPDEDLPELVYARVRPLLDELEACLEEAVGDAERGRRVRDGYRIALIGSPNAGKSTLFNALAGRDAAIVSATPGTTRDVLELRLVIAGFVVLVADTAGLREAADEIEAEGVSRARRWAEDADLRLWVVDGTAGLPSSPDVLRPDDMALATKMDLPGHTDHGGLSVSALNASGLDDLWRLLERRVASDLAGAEFPSGTRLRHAAALQDALLAVRAAQHRLADHELAAEEVQRGARVLDSITGRIDAEQVLGRIFSSFCIGK